MVRITLVALAALALAPAARADLTLVASRADFNSAYPGASFEDFEKARVADGDVATFTGPLDATTNNTVFHTGDIVAGLQIVVPGAGDLFVSSNGFDNYTSHAISFNSGTTPQPQITLNFTNNNAKQVAFDLTSNPDGGSVAVDVFSGATSLGTFTVNNVLGSGTFFGLASSSDAITSVTLSSGPFSFFGVDNVAFTASPAAVPEPSTLASAGLGLVSMVLAKWRKRPRA